MGDFHISKKWTVITMLAFGVVLAGNLSLTILLAVQLWAETRGQSIAPPSSIQQATNFQQAANSSNISDVFFSPTSLMPSNPPFLAYSLYNHSSQDIKRIQIALYFLWPEDAAAFDSEERAIWKTSMNNLANSNKEARWEKRYKALVDLEVRKRAKAERHVQSPCDIGPAYSESWYDDIMPLTSIPHETEELGLVVGDAEIISVEWWP